MARKTSQTGQAGKHKTTYESSAAKRAKSGESHGGKKLTFDDIKKRIESRTHRTTAQEDLAALSQLDERRNVALKELLLEVVEGSPLKTRKGTLHIREATRFNPKRQGL